MPQDQDSQFAGNDLSSINPPPATLDVDIASGMRPETADFLNDLAGIGTGAYLSMRRSDAPEYEDWREQNFVPDDSGNYVSREGQAYADDDLERMHGVLSRQAGNPLVSRLFAGPKSPLADYMTWRYQNYYNDNAIGGAWEDEDGNLYTEPALQEIYGAKFATHNQDSSMASGETTTGQSRGTQQAPSSQGGGTNGNPDASRRASQIPFFAPKDVPPPAPPAPPGVPPFAFDRARINKLTVEQVAGVVFNENRDVMPGQSTPADLQAAKTAQAHAVINADRRFGLQRQKKAGTATWQVPLKLKSSDQYQQALAAARTAFQEDNLDYDPTGGKVHFNNRFEGTDLTAPRFVNGQPQTPFHTYGPFTVGGGRVWTVIYNEFK